jgi:hypothetical protein
MITEAVGIYRRVVRGNILFCGGGSCRTLVSACPFLNLQADVREVKIENSTL